MSEIPFDHGIAGDAVTPSSQALVPAPVSSEPDQLELMLENGEHLLNYAVEAGIPLDAELMQPILAARPLGPAIFDGPDGGSLVAAMTKLAQKIHPVTAETLRACREDSDDAIRSYKHVAGWLAAFIIPLSMISFIYTAISNSITPDLKTGNELAVALHTQLDPADPNRSVPPGALSGLQQFAATMRAVYGHASQLNVFALRMVPDPTVGPGSEMQLPANLQLTVPALQKELDNKTKIYQDVRLFATNVQDITSVIWGAVGACILPVLYALLGACAYLLRSFADQVEKRTFALSDATTARFIIAAIGGMVVGLFSNFTVGQSASLSPLALAFLVGYAADIFFSFLEGLMQTFRAGGGQPVRRPNS